MRTDCIDVRVDTGHKRVVRLEVVKVIGESNDVIGIWGKVITANGLGLDWPALPFEHPGAFVTLDGDD
mgnify:CR=1 FL=1